MADEAISPLVSAIIVVLNGERFLAEAIESVLAQTWVDWELIIADDGSTDRSREIALAFAADDPRIRLIAHPDGGNYGIAATRNLTLTVARGAYIAFLDADDVWMPEKLAEQVAILESDPELGAVYGRSLIWHSWNPLDDRPDYYYPLGVDHDLRHDPPILFELLMLNKTQTPTTCNIMIRAELFRRIGGFEPRFRAMFEDYSFYCKALAVTPIYVSDRTWAKYRQHCESVTAVSAMLGKDRYSWLEFLLWLGKAMAPMHPSQRVRRAIWLARARAILALARSGVGSLKRQFLGGNRA